MKNKEHIVVIGAGIVGLSTAIWLRRAGRDVTVVDKGKPGMGTSYGNAGIIAACGIAPVTAPGLTRKGPLLLLDPNFPLFLRWSYLPRLAPWLRKYLSHANEADTRRISEGLRTIVCDSVEQHKALIKGTGAEHWITDSDYCFGYSDRAMFEADAFVLGLRREAGFVPELIEGNAVQDYEPALAKSVGLLAVMKDHAYVRAPHKYVQALAQVLLAEGGALKQAEVREVELDTGQIKAVITDQGRMECDKAVIATGVWSKPLAKKLGLNVPLESERGYHIVFKNPSITLNNPIMLATGKFVATPMEDGLRCAGIVEFGGLKAGPSKAPLKLMRKQVKKNFPTLEFDGVEEWMGHRPAPTDSLPLIGEIGGSGVYAGFGHHHIGLTGGPKTGRMIADMIALGGSNLDTSPFDPLRFSK